MDYKNKVYRNYFAELGIDASAIEKRKEEIFQTLFYGTEEERIYHPAGEDMGYMEDTGNHDARTEGMSYGMMMCVQTDHQEEFNRLWKWARTYMYLTDGPAKGYFAWSCGLDGSKNAYGPAPDGEEFFVMALFFASHRWGDGEGIFNYSQEAKELLHTCIRKGENGEEGRGMWDPENKLIRFVTDVDFSDPSYHLPHFYQLFAEWAYEEDREFFREATKNSREYLHLACHEKTGMCAEYAEYNGKPWSPGKAFWGYRHDWFYSDSYRTMANIGLDYSWWAADEEQRNIANRLQAFFMGLPEENREYIYEIDGTCVEEKVLHPVGLLATMAQGSLAANGPYADEYVRTFWNTPLRTGDRRYYDNCLYFFAFLALSGNYRIY